MKRIDFWMQGEPVGKGRPRFTRQGRAYTPKKTRDYELKLASKASDKMVELGLDPIDVPCRVSVMAQFAIPKSYSKKRREAATMGEIIPTRVDADNVLKIITDACNGVLYEDDRLIYKMTVQKRFGDPMVIITLEWH